MKIFERRGKEMKKKKWLNAKCFPFSVADCKQIKMPPSNIAKIFGPTLVGYSSNDPDQHAIFTETIIQASVS